MLFRALLLSFDPFDLFVSWIKWIIWSFHHDREVQSLEKVTFVFAFCVEGQDTISSSYFFHQGCLLINFASNLSVSVSEKSNRRF